MSEYRDYLTQRRKWNDELHVVNERILREVDWYMEMEMSPVTFTKWLTNLRKLHLTRHKLQEGLFFQKRPETSQGSSTAPAADKPCGTAASKASPAGPATAAAAQGPPYVGPCDSCGSARFNNVHGVSRCDNCGRIAL